MIWTSDLFRRAKVAVQFEASKATHTATMRPSMRLPLREALYVCSICKSEATPRRVSPLVRQIRRYASDSPSVLERTRRSLWKGDKPPGQADPYSGGSQIASKDGGYAGELAAGVEGEEFKLGDQYVQAETWDGLRRIGFTEEEAWKERGSNGADKYSRYVRLDCWGSLNCKSIQDGQQF